MAFSREALGPWGRPGLVTFHEHADTYRRVRQSQPNKIPKQIRAKSVRP